MTRSGNLKPDRLLVLFWNCQSFQFYASSTHNMF